MDEFVRAATSGRRARAEALLRRSDRRVMGAARARRRLGRRRQRPGRPERLGAPALRRALRLRVRRPRARVAGPRRRPERHLQQPVRRDERALRRRRRRPRPRAHARAAGGGRGPRRRRVRLPRHRGRVPGVPAAADRPRRDARADHARARARRRAARSTCGCCSRAASTRPSCSHSPSAAAAARTCSCSSTRRRLEHRAGEGWRDPERLRTAYQHARLRNADASAALADLGARHRTSTPTTSRSPRSPAARARAAPSTPTRPAGGADPGRAARPRGERDRPLRPGLPRASSAVRRRLRCCTTPRGSAPRRSSTSCWPRARTRGGEWSPLAAAFASGDAARDHVGVAERLVAAGNVIEPRMLEQADGPLAALARGALGRAFRAAAACPRGPSRREGGGGRRACGRKGHGTRAGTRDAPRRERIPRPSGDRSERGSCLQRARVEPY